MKLRTSYFNPTVLKKDITRFAPVWALYTVFQVMFVLLLAENEGTAERFATEAPYIMMSMGVVNFCYAGLCAVLLFGDLFQPKMCNALHAMPLRREGWFLTHTCAGLLFCLVPNLLGMLITLPLLQQYGYLALLWLAVMVLQYLFFFGVGAFSVMCAGSRLGACAVYGIVNFLAVLVAWLAMTFYEPLLYGISLDVDRFANYSPVVAFSSSQYFSLQYDKQHAAALWLGFLQEHWTYLFVAAGVGVVLSILAVLIYRSRKLESAGDLISLPAVAPVFLVIYTLGAGAAMYYIADIVSDSFRYPFLVIGLILGFFTGKMLLAKKVNVFQGKTFLGFGIFITVFALTLGLTALDPLGVTRYVPDTEDVVSARLYNNYDSLYGRDKVPGSSDTEEIDGIRTLHRQILATREDTFGKPTVRACIQYTLKNGSTLSRYYTVAVDSPVGETLKRRFSDFEYLFRAKDPAELADRISFIEVSRYEDKTGGPSYAYKIHDPEVILQLLEAVKRDCDAGNMAENGVFHRDEDSVGYLLIELNSEKAETQPGGYEDVYIPYLDATIYENCTSTRAFLDSYTPDPSDIYK